MNKFIEWFIKKAFPVILKLLMAYSEEIVRSLIKIIYKYMSDRKKDEAKENINIVKENLKKADNASTDEERKAFTIEAEFYKRLAEANVKEIQDLAKEFAEIEEKTVRLVVENTAKLKVENLFELNKKNEGIELKEEVSYLDIVDNKSIKDD